MIADRIRAQTAEARQRIMQKINELLDNVEWSKLTESILTDIERASLDGQGFASIQLNPYQEIGSICNEPIRNEWTPAGAYCEGYRTRLTTLLEDMGFVISFMSNLGWGCSYDNTWILRVTITWE